MGDHMANPRGEPLDLTNLRYWQQNARMAIRDVYDALVEIITNADDRYVCLKEKKGRIDIEVERRRKGTPSVIRIRDFADGMTLDVMRNKLRRVGDRVSGMAEGVAVRGTNSRGAKDVAILGGVVFESIAVDGHYHRCEITPQGMFKAHPISKDNVALQRVKLDIPEGTGTVVTISVDSEVYRIPQHDTLRQELRQLVVLRDIISSPEREVVLRDVTQGRSDVIAPLAFEGKERISERFIVPGYEGAEAKLVIKRSRERLEDQRPRFRLGGILIKSKHAIHEATLFSPDLENDPNAKWFYGRLTCATIDDIWNDFDNRFEKGLPPTIENPRPILDPMRKEGLSREHPFVDALFKEALRRLRPLVEEERKQAEHQQAKIESEDTRKRLRILEKAAAKFIGDNQEQEESTRDADDTVADSAFENKGFSLNPPVCPDHLGARGTFLAEYKTECFSRTLMY
jgi:hypothetical protein